MTWKFIFPLTLLLISFGSIEGREGYPEFSWDRVPLYAHVGLGKGLKPKEYEFLADHYGFIAFTGGTMDREYRTDDEITFEHIVTKASRSVKQHNPKAKILFYLAGATTRAGNKISNAKMPKNGRIQVQRNANTTVQIFDTTNEQMRDWWTDIATKAVHEYGCDGIFVDGGTTFTPGGPYEKILGKEKAGPLEQGMFAMLKEAKRKMGPESILFLNPLHGPKEGQTEEEALGWRYLSVFEGAMIDDFDRAANIMQKRQSKEYIVSTIKMMSTAAKRGEIVVFKAWPGFTWWSDEELMKKPHADQYAVAVKNLEFPLACFLIGAEKYCYFCYTWGWLPEYGTFDWYPEFDRPLGEPKGDAIQKDWTFRREFEHASVYVDVEKRKGKIDWK